MAGGITKYTEKEIGNITAGQGPKDIISDTNTHTGNWVVLHAVTDVVFDTLVDSTINSGSMNGKTLYAGQVYFGDVTSIKLTSGTLIAYGG